MKSKKTQKKKYSKRVAVGGALGMLTLATTGVASAHLGGNSETRAAIKAAFAAQDFTAFQEAAANTQIIEQIDSQEKFEKIIEAHELKAAGDRAGAQVIRAELGLKDRHSGKGKNSAAKDAVEANDYTAFQEAINDGHFAEKINSAEKFAKLVEVNELRAAGEYEQARAIMEELGISHRDRKGKGHHHDSAEE